MDHVRTSEESLGTVDWRNRSRVAQITKVRGASDMLATDAYRSYLTAACESEAWLVDPVTFGKTRIEDACIRVQTEYIRSSGRRDSTQSSVEAWETRRSKNDGGGSRRRKARERVGSEGVGVGGF